jgi:hypothetical protein
MLLYKDWAWWWLKVKIQVLHHNTDVSEVPGFSKLSVTIYQSWRRDASEGFYLHYNLWKWHKFCCDVMQYLDMYGCVIFSTRNIPSVTLPYLSTQLFTVSVGCLCEVECVQNPRLLRLTYTSVTKCVQRDSHITVDLNLTLWRRKLIHFTHKYSVLASQRTDYIGIRSNSQWMQCRETVAVYC